MEPDQWDKFKKTVEKQDKTRGEVLRKLINQYIEVNNRKNLF
ncbi:MAG: hypothetical protein ACOCUI_04545 [bacterium]